MSLAADPSTVVLVPVRSFRHGKTRLGRALSSERRRELARACAERVVGAAGELPVAVMTEDAEVAAWAASASATVIGDEGWDLNSSVEHAVGWLRDRGAARVIVAHADLPLADDLTWLEDHGDVVIVPDRHADGTNVLAIPTAPAFRFAYGKGSSYHHDGEALRLGLDAVVVRDPLLGWDLDVPDDLALPEGPDLDRLRQASLRVRQATAPALRRPAPLLAPNGGGVR